MGIIVHEKTDQKKQSKPAEMDTLYLLKSTTSSFYSSLKGSCAEELYYKKPNDSHCISFGFFIPNGSCNLEIHVKVNTHDVKAVLITYLPDSIPEFYIGEPASLIPMLVTRLDSNSPFFKTLEKDFNKI